MYVMGYVGNGNHKVPAVLVVWVRVGLGPYGIIKITSIWPVNGDQRK